ncbi:MAG: chorismate mutase [Phenylobacterium sp.]
MADAQDTTGAPSLEAVRARIDQVDAELLRLVDERAGLAVQVAAAKAAAGEADRFALRPGRETKLLRGLLGRASVAPPRLVVRIWRELIGDSLCRQGPYSLAVWGGARAVELARSRFGASARLAVARTPEDAIGAARALGAVGVLALTPDSHWWGRLLAEPKVKVFAALPCLAVDGPLSVLAVADVDVEPTGADFTFWVTDEPGPAAKVLTALSHDGVAASLLAEGGGLKLFSLAGYYMPGDERLARAPGRLTGVIGAAPAPLDV